MRRGKAFSKSAVYAVLILLSAVFLSPIFIILINALKSNFYISQQPFTLPDSETFVGLENFTKGIEQSDFLRALANSAVITLFSVAGIVLLTSMTAWYIVREIGRAHV